MGAERRLRAPRGRFGPCPVRGHLENVLAVFKLWLGFGGVMVCRATVSGFLDKIAAVWFSRARASLLLVRGILWRFLQPVPYGLPSCQCNGAPRWTLNNCPLLRVVGGFCGNNYRIGAGGVAAPRKPNKQGGAGATGAHQRVRCRAGSHQPLGRVAAPTAATSAHQRPPGHQARTRPAAMRQILTLPFFTMYTFSTVKKACDFLINKTGKHWEAKFYIYDGERFYFVWQAIELPFYQRQLSLVCRGNKKDVLAKLEKIANAPMLPNFV